MLSWILSNGITLLGFGGYAVVGALVILGYFRQDDGRLKASEELASNLINRLQQTVEQNSKDMTAMSKRMDDQQKEIHLLQGKNEAYLQIITLRDPDVAKVFDEAPEIYKIARETHEYAKAQADALKKLTDTMEEFLNRMPAVMPVMTT